MNTPLISATNIWKSYGSHEVLKGVSLHVNKGEAVCLLGRSGSGKSTLLRCMNMLERPDRGVVLLDGQIMGYREQGGKLYELPGKLEAKQRQQLGMVFQQFNLFPHMTVVENVLEAPTRVKKVRADIARKEAMELLDRVGLVQKAKAFPEELSGGQQQRVAIARALAMKPKAILFDEPTSSLDPETVSEVLQVIRSLVRDGMTTVIVTHEIGFAREVCDRFAFMENGDIIEEGGPAALYGNAVLPATRDFLAKVL